MSLASSDVPKDDAPARKSATSKKDSTKSFPKFVSFEEAFARTDGDDDPLLRAARVKEARGASSAAQLPPPAAAAARPVRLDDDDDEEEEEEHQRCVCWGRRFVLISRTSVESLDFDDFLGKKRKAHHESDKKKEEKEDVSADKEREKEYKEL
jgi:hypothetical protein